MSDFHDKFYGYVDCDICRECGEHTEFEEGQSNCCGAKPYDSDPDVDMER